MNYARNPNVRIHIVGRVDSDGIHHAERVDMIAREDIGANVMLTFNYNSTEWCMDDQFVDWATGDLVAGFSNLSYDEQLWMLAQSDLVSPHIRAHAEREGIVARSNTGSLRSISPCDSDAPLREAVYCDENWNIQSEVILVEGSEGTRSEALVLTDGCVKGTVLVSVKASDATIHSKPTWDTLQVNDYEHSKFNS